MKPPALPRVTDHAVLRYLERVQGFDVETVRRKIAERCAAPMASGAVSLIFDGHRFEFSNGAVITVVPYTGMANRTREARLVRARVQR